MALIPKYPIYIVSKGRAESHLTASELEYLKVPYRIVIEPQEYNDYSKYIDEKKILILPFSNLGQGSIPARNWIWEHSISSGHERHWVLDDNIRHFRRMVNGIRIRVSDGVIFNLAENFTDRYENVALSGFDYTFFSVNRTKPFLANTRIYSCILIKNDIPFRWRGKYNEDTDLSLRILKSGYCTLLFYAFLCDKMTTMSMRGGNTEDLYLLENQTDGRYLMAKSLKDQHPDIVRIAKRYGRWQHVVDYRPFRANKLILKPNLQIPDQINNYGMDLFKEK